MILSEEDLVRWGRCIGESMRTPAFLGLRGPLGAGKSVLARAVARGAGVEGSLPSPTFNLLFRYASPRGIHLVHVDLYRLKEPDELWELGWAEIPAPDELVLVEWPERAGPLLPDDRWDLRLDPPSPGSALREVEVHRIGEPPHLPGFPVQVSSP